MRMHGRGAIGFSHGLIMTAWLLVLGALLVLRVNWEQARVSLAQSVQLHVVFVETAPQEVLAQAIAHLRVMPEVARAVPRDLRRDQELLLTQEPWAQEFAQAVKGNFLPVAIDVEPLQPFMPQAQFEDWVARIRALPGVDTVIHPAESYPRLVSMVTLADRLLLLALSGVVLLTFITCGAIEWLRLRAERHAPAESPHIADVFAERLLIGVLSLVVTLTVVTLAINPFSRSLNIPILLFRLSDILLLAVVALVPSLAWASVVRALSR